MIILEDGGWSVRRKPGCRNGAFQVFCIETGEVANVEFKDDQIAWDFANEANRMLFAKIKKSY